MITLQDLAAWESRVAMLVARLDGDLEERDRALERSGLYAEYPAILSAYVELLDDEESGLEALKRATFIAWVSAVEPSFVTGIAELPEMTVRDVFERLEATCRDEAYDDELEGMLTTYRACGEDSLLRYPGLAAIDTVSNRVPTPWTARMENRGLMGTWWQRSRDPGLGIRDAT